MKQFLLGGLGGLMMAAYVLGIAGGLSASETEDAALRVMTFNVRYGTANDGDNAWDQRKQLLVDVIRQFDPDLLGTQEVLATQADFLQGKLSDYEMVGVGRDDGQRQGEFSAAFFKKQRFEALDSGTFWLSETPDVPGSKSWDSSLPRIVTWVRLRDRDAPQRELLWLNTHWDHRGRQARVESGKMIRRFVDEHAGDALVLVTGDLNVNEDHPGVQAMLAEESVPRLADLYRQAHPDAHPDESTFGGFRGTTQGKRIDFILGSAECRVTDADIVRTSRDGRYPSDHYPVTAVVKLPPAKK
jgi:endonuclease/exonuclease/phosphatase family metal-dependent hydrolase